VLVLGAGAAGARLVSELSRSDTWQVVALLDDDMTKLAPASTTRPLSGDWHKPRMWRGAWCTSRDHSDAEYDARSAPPRR
jgi:hypothetical protein